MVFFCMFVFGHGRNHKDLLKPDYSILFGFFCTQHKNNPKLKEPTLS